MNLFERVIQLRTGLLIAMTAGLLTGCGGGTSLDPILGSPVAGTLPTVTSTSPIAGTPAVTGVAVGSSVSATFSKAMAPATLDATSFTLACPASTPITGAVAYDAATHVATLTPAGALPYDTECTATISTAAQDVTGFALASNFVWSFVTAPAPDVTPPTVVLTVPAAGTTNVANNTQVSAVFSEDMNPATLTGTSVTLVNDTLGTAVSGAVSYSATGRSVIFTPTNPATLADNTRFTATVTTAATDVAGNALVAPVSWSFTTSAVPDTTRPTVVSAVPAPNASAVASNTRITATFSEDMNPATLSGSTFTLVDTTLGTPVAGTVSYSATSRTAVFTPAAPTLSANSQFIATITTGVTDLAGNALAANFTWSFATAALSDTTRPTVVLTVPAPAATAVPNNTKITATFSEGMDPATVSGTTFALTNTTLGVAVQGNVSYSAVARTASFTPTTPAQLANNSSFTARITASAKDLSGNGLAGNTAVGAGAGDHVWTFTTAAVGDTTPPSVTAISPTDGASGQCLTKAVSATFSEPMDAATIDAATLTVTDAGVAVAGSVSYDAASRVASFVPTAVAGFAPSRSFVVTVKSGAAGVKDLAGNPMAADRVWGFATGTQACMTAVDLGTAASFGAFGGAAGLTNQGINSVVGGNMGSTAVCTAITGFHDAANVYTETPLNIGLVNGSIYCAPPAPGTTSTLAIATRARADAQTAYNALAAMPPGGDPGAGQLGGLVLPAAVYTSASGTFAITNGDLTLDAQGDSNAVWVFQSAAALTVGQPALPRRVVLINGAQARNVFWQVGSAARIADRSTMVGTIIAPAGVTISTAGQTAQTTLIGRAIGLTASVTIVNTTIVAP